MRIRSSLVQQQIAVVEAPDDAWEAALATISGR
jgi:hypothetical protein